MITEHALPVSGTPDSLRTFEQTTSAGKVQTEAVTLANPDDPSLLPGINTPLVVSESKTSGTWGYKAGVTGTPTIPAGSKLLQISAAAPALSAASFTINGGDTVTVPAGQAVTFEPRGNLITPTVVFTSTASYVVEFVS